MKQKLTALLLVLLPLSLLGGKDLPFAWLALEDSRVHGYRIFQNTNNFIRMDKYQDFGLVTNATYLDVPYGVTNWFWLAARWTDLNGNTNLLGTPTEPVTWIGELPPGAPQGFRLDTNRMNTIEFIIRVPGDMIIKEK